MSGYKNFFSDPDGFWTSNSLGNKQEQSFKAWLIDAEMIDQKKNLTPFGDFCTKHRENELDLIWELIWINLHIVLFLQIGLSTL